MDALDDENSVFDLYLSARVCPGLSRVDLQFARCQRAGECAEQSACCRRNDIVESRRMRFFQLARRYSVVFRHRSVSAEEHWLRLARKVSNTEWPGDALKLDLRNVSYFGHLVSSGVIIMMRQGKPQISTSWRNLNG